VHIGDGYGDALSPDGKWILAHNGAKLMLLPTGSGESRELKLIGNFDFGADWLPDSKRVVIGGALPKSNYRLILLDTLDETVKPLSPENIWANTLRPFTVSPNGRYVAGMTADETIALYPLGEGDVVVPVRGVGKGEVPIDWTHDNAAGARELWKEFAPNDPAGIYKIAPVFMARDTGAYAYNALRTTNDLYVAEGLK
jgi:WD40 repeat protein